MAFRFSYNYRCERATAATTWTNEWMIITYEYFKRMKWNYFRLFGASTMHVIRMQPIHFHLRWIMRPVKWSPQFVTKGAMSSICEFAAINSEFMGHNPQNLFECLIWRKTNARNKLPNTSEHCEKSADEKLTQKMNCELKCLWWSAHTAHSALHACHFIKINQRRHCTPDRSANAKKNGISKRFKWTWSKMKSAAPSKRSQNQVKCSNALTAQCTRATNATFFSSRSCLSTV